MEILKIFELPNGEYSLVTWNGAVHAPWDHKPESLLPWLKAYHASPAWVPGDADDDIPDIAPPHCKAKGVLTLFECGWVEISLLLLGHLCAPATPLSGVIDVGEDFESVIVDLNFKGA